MFYVGQKVVCVGLHHDNRGLSLDEARRLGYGQPKLRGIYTVRSIFVWQDRQLLRLAEFDNSHRMVFGMEPGYPAEGFRPVVERKTDISIFKAMLEPSPARVKELWAQP